MTVTMNHVPKYASAITLSFHAIHVRMLYKTTGESEVRFISVFKYKVVEKDEMKTYIFIKIILQSCICRCVSTIVPVGNDE